MTGGPVLTYGKAPLMKTPIQSLFYIPAATGNGVVLRWFIEAIESRSCRAGVCSHVSKE